MSRGLSAPEKAELWRRWKAGETIADIAWTMGKGEMGLYQLRCVDPLRRPALHYRSADTLLTLLPARAQPVKN